MNPNLFDLDTFWQNESRYRLPFYRFNNVSLLECLFIESKYNGSYSSYVIYMLLRGTGFKLAER